MITLSPLTWIVGALIKSAIYAIYFTLSKSVVCKNKPIRTSQRKPFSLPQRSSVFQNAIHETKFSNLLFTRPISKHSSPWQTLLLNNKPSWPSIMVTSNGAFKRFFTIYHYKYIKKNNNSLLNPSLASTSHDLGQI